MTGPLDNLVVGIHSPCTDGRGAGFIFHKKLPNVPQYELKHGNPPPADWVGKKIIMADFSYPYEILKELVQKNELVTVWDHHKGAQDICERVKAEFPDKFVYVFDNQRSGAGITADMYGLRNPFIDAVERQDLWTANDNERAINEFLRCYDSGTDYSTFEELYQAAGTQAMAPYIVAGRGMLDFKRQQVQLSTKFAHEVEIAGHKVWAANVPYFLCSETANELIRDRPFGVTYYWDGAQAMWKLSFRSVAPFDVAAIARQFGGNGHQQASGASVKVLPWTSQ